MTNDAEANSCSSLRVNVWISTSFVAYHRWLEAPADVAFLRDWHRHKFGVRLACRVSDANRQIEFFQLQRKVSEYIRNNFENHYFEFSCEAIAINLLSRFQAEWVEVNEDGENGATVSKE